MVYGLALLPNGEFAAAGFLSSAGNAAASSIARWTNTGISWVAQRPAAQSVNPGATLTLTAACASA